MTLVGRFDFDKETLKKHSTETIIAGVLMMIVGLTGVLAPGLMSVATVYFLAWLFLFSGIVQGYNTWKNYNGHIGAWLKPTVSLIAAFLLFFFPVSGVPAVGLLIAAYLLVDAYSSFTFAWQYRPNKGWVMMLINGILSVILAIIFIIGWPYSSFLLVGLFVGISLFFDGAALVGMGLGAKKITDEEIAEQKAEKTDATDDGATKNQTNDTQLGEKQ